MAWMVFGSMGYLFNLGTHVIWEILENSPFVIQLWRTHDEWSGSYIGDSRLNMIGDLLSFSVGYQVAQFLGSTTWGYAAMMAWLGAIEWFAWYFTKDTVTHLVFLMAKGSPPLAASSWLGRWLGLS